MIKFKNRFLERTLLLVNIESGISTHLKGATPVGKLCVSAVNIRCCLIFSIWKLLHLWVSIGRRIGISKPSIALLLSLNLITLFGLEYFCVSVIIVSNDFSCSLPSKIIRPLKNQWRLCSLLDWARSKHSTLVGLRFNFNRNNSV